MKKIILLILPFMISGCYDYVELTDLAIITMITIDKDDNEYNLSFEILNSQNKNDQSIIVNGSGKTITSAMNNSFKNTPKQPYLAHLKAIVISKQVAENNLKELVEYFLRSPNVRNELYLLIFDGQPLENLFNIRRNSIPVISDYLEKTINQNTNSSNNINIKNFEKIIIEIFEKGKDTTVPVISLSNKSISMVGNALMKNYEMKSIIGDTDSLILNVLDGKINSATETFQCPDNEGSISLTIYDSNSSYKVVNNILNITINMKAEIDEYNCKMNLKEVESIKTLNKYYANKYKEKVKNFYTLISHNNTDILGIGKILYNKKRYYEENEWLNLIPEYKVDLRINKEGLTFEVENGN